MPPTPNTSNFNIVGPNGELPNTVQDVIVSIQFNKDGRPKPVDPSNPPTFEVQGDGMGLEVKDVTYGPEDNSKLKARFKLTDTAGRADVLMRADPDMGDGDTDLSVLLHVEWKDELANNAAVTVEFVTRSE